MANVVVWDGVQKIPSDVNRVLIVARDGFFQFKRLVLAGQTIIEAITKIGTGWDDESIQPFGDERLSLGFAEKIPQPMFQRAVSFASAVYQRFQGEAILLLFYAPRAPAGQRWQVMVPEQVVTGGHLDYTDPGPARAGWFLAGDIHSHGSMSGFHSGTDDDDEHQRDGIHITVGGVNSSLPSLAVSVMVDGSRFKLDLADVVEGIVPATFPEEWLSRVSKPEPAPTPASNWQALLGRESDGLGNEPLSTCRAVQTHVLQKRSGRGK